MSAPLPIRAEPRKCRSARTRAAAGTLVCFVLSGVGLSGFGANLHGQANALALPDPASAKAPRTVSGVVRNSLTGAAIPRALVTLNGRAVLTDAEGQFGFRQVTAGQGFVMVRKPGFASPVAGQGAIFQHFYRSLDDRLDLTLAPDALLTGVITGSDGLPVEGAEVVLHSLLGDAAGRHLNPAGVVRSDRRGGYRFDVTPGRYRISLHYTARSSTSGAAMLPAAFPEAESLGPEGTFPAAAGQQVQIDLHPAVKAATPVLFVADAPANVLQVPQILVQTSAGNTFTTMALPSGPPGEFRVDLPPGAYRLRATFRGREESLEGEMRVVVGSEKLSGLMLHLAPIPRIPVETSIDRSDGFASMPGAGSQGLQAPKPASLNLSLQSAETVTEDFSGASRLVNAQDGSEYFLARSGTYRLEGGNWGAWFVKSATYGATDLLAHDLHVGPGGGSTPIRLVLSRNPGVIRGSVHSADGTPVEAYVYAVAHDPALVRVSLIRASDAGSLRWQAAPGTYSFYAFPEPFLGDLESPDAASLSSKVVSISGGANADLDLTVTTPGPTAAAGGSR